MTKPLTLNINKGKSKSGSVVFGFFGRFLCHWFNTRAYWKCLQTENFSLLRAVFEELDPLFFFLFFFCSTGGKHEVVVSWVSSTFISCSFVVICTSGFDLHSRLWPVLSFQSWNLTCPLKIFFFPPHWSWLSGSCCKCAVAMSSIFTFLSTPNPRSSDWLTVILERREGCSNLLSSNRLILKLLYHKVSSMV